MALATRRSYAGAAPACTLSSDISASATSFSITGTTTNWPSTATGPFYMVIDPGLSTEEKVLVGARTSGSLSSVTRGVDGTTAASHVTGATCYPVFTAVDANDANLLASRLSAKGDLISSDGTDPTKVAVGANNTRLVADSAQTSGIKWVADTQNTVVDAKGDLLVGTANDTIARLAVGTNDQYLVAASGETTGLKWATLASYSSYTPTFSGFTLGNGTITNAKYVQVGKLVHVWGFVTLGSTSTMTGPLDVTLPVTATAGILAPAGTCQFYNGTLLYWGQMIHISTGALRLVAQNAGSTYLYNADIGATVPFSWANTHSFAWTHTYEAA